MPKPQKPKRNLLALSRYIGSRSSIFLELEHPHQIDGIPRVSIIRKDEYGLPIGVWASVPSDPSTKIVTIKGGRKGLKATVICSTGEEAPEPGVTIVPTVGVEEGAITVEITITNPPAGGNPPDPSTPLEDEAILFP